jgi:undecaprenyl-diphosphatase
MDQLDRDIYAAVAASPSPLLDEPMQRLSNAANFSKLWMGIAAALMLIGRRKGRRAGVTGLVAIAVSSGVTNQGIKRMAPRERPDRERGRVVEARRVAMPAPTSFPSGHSASGFAFATAVGSQAPLVGMCR